MRIVLGSLLILCTQAIHSEAALCTKDVSNPSFPVATCRLPDCVTGADCLPPELDRATAWVDFGEPVLRWASDCNEISRNGCWEVRFFYTLRLGATDSAGVDEIGLHLRREVLNEEQSRFKLFTPAVEKDANGRYKADGVFLQRVKAGGQISLAVFELCARDRRGNEGCVYPAHHFAVTR